MGIVAGLKGCVRVQAWAFSDVCIRERYDRKSPHKDRMQLCACPFPYGLHGSVAADPLQNQVFFLITPMAFISSLGSHQVLSLSSDW